MKAKIVQEFCVRHMHGSFIDGPFGLECVECLKKADDLPEDYEPCGDCGFDHSYEPYEADQVHRQWAAEDKYDGIKNGDFE